MRSVNLHEAKTHLSELVGSAAAGEEIIIAKSGIAMARLVPLEKPEPRQPGLAKGKLTDAFFEPLSIEELDAWTQ